MTASSHHSPAPTMTDGIENLAIGMTVFVRDEEWAITGVEQARDGKKLTVRGLTDYVRDKTATFYTALDDIKVFDPAQVTPRFDTSPNFRHSRLWVETMMRQTPVPLYQTELTVAGRMLADPLDYQLEAVRKALDPETIRPRILLADAVGLGKTLEIGMIVSELIRRGRGDRILVVTPKHVMDQFQNELWSRFAIPLVRLDSQGIARIRQVLPASRNPFTYFPRAIVSMDTLKSAKFSAQLEKVNWDIVVIDEIHNATNTGTQNNELARRLAPKTEALILASATPHNGDPDSFREILRLLDPTAVRPDKTVDLQAAKRLIIRRHRHSPEVASVVGEKWAERAEPQNILVTASAEENAVAEELHSTWISPDGNPPVKDSLFPWTLVKAFLSSPAALAETIEGRISRVDSSNDPQRAAELRALRHLAELTAEVTPEKSAKYQQLIATLKAIPISSRSSQRVVIFSERVATLRWLQQHLVKDLKLKDDSVAIMHGGLPEEAQLSLIDEFKRADSPIRVLITGDVASEGVNLHAQCHQLIHYDIPWSLIRIQQRNGRIDRYGQEHNPVITTLLLDPAEQSSPGELHVLTRLVEREAEAHKLLGDASSLMGKYSDRQEEDEIRKVLAGEKNFDDAVRTAQEVQRSAENAFGADDATDDFLDFLLNDVTPPDDDTAVATESPARSSTPISTASLYSSEYDYLRDSLFEAFHNVPTAKPAAGGVSFTTNKNDTAELVPPPDLQRRLRYLPQEYVQQRNVKDRLVLATSEFRGNASLDDARGGSSTTTWPAAHFLGPLHPVLDWAADRALAAMGRRDIPVVCGDVESPTVVILATMMNKRGQVISLATLVASNDLIMNAQPVENIFAWLSDHGLGSQAINPGTVPIPDDAQELIRNALDAAEGTLSIVAGAAKDLAENQKQRWRSRAEEWLSLRHSVRDSAPLFLSDEQIKEERRIADSLDPLDDVLLRPMLLVLPRPDKDAVKGDS